MKYEITSGGHVAANGQRFVLDADSGAGVLVQPAATTAAYRLQDRWREMYRAATAELAERLGKKPDELTDDERKNLDVPITEEFIASLEAVMRSCFVGWDDGLVQFEGTSVKPSAEVGDGLTAADAWIRYMCEHDVPTVIQIMATAAGRAQELEGNSEGPSAGTGGTGEEQQAAEAPESTATAVPSTADQAPASPSADISEVPASPV